MDPNLVATLVLFGAFAVLMLLDVPVAVSLGIAGVLALYVWGRIPLIAIPQTMLNGIDSYAFLAVPFFLLAGVLMGEGGITRRLIDLAMALVGPIPGGLSHVNVVSSVFFAGMSGSDAADSAGLGEILIPAMKERGYTPGYSAAITATSASVGPLIPPSIALIIFGTVSNLSIANLFLAGALPGIVMALTLLAAGTLISRFRNFPREERVELLEVMRRFVRALPAVGMPVLVIGGILTGVFTATEAGAISVVYAIIVGSFLYRELTWRKIGRSLLSAAKLTSTVLFIAATAFAFAFALTNFRAAEGVANMVTGLTNNPTVFLVLVAVFYLMTGAFLEAIPNMLIFTPIFLPAALALNIDPYHFAIVTVYTLMIGLNTPPYGMSMFIVTRIANVSVSEYFSEARPLLAASVVGLLFVIMIPAIATFLPYSLG